MNVPILFDDDVSSRVSMRDAIDAVEEVLALKARGEFLTPPRYHLQNKNGALVFTMGGHNDEGVIGFRVYGTFPAATGDHQLVAVFDSNTGELKGLVLGSLLGEMRTGAIGGVAVKHASRADARVAGVIGAGAQARTQLAATAAVRDLSEGRVYSRDRANRDRFAHEMTERLGIDVVPVSSAAEAIRGADIVLTATNSGRPAFDAALIEPGTHVTTVGPKFAGAHELDLGVADRAAAIFTDSLDQVRAYPTPFFLSGTRHEARVTDLSAHVAGGAPIRRSEDDITLFCSVGLSGTEVVVADIALSSR